MCVCVCGGGAYGLIIIPIHFSINSEIDPWFTKVLCEGKNTQNVLRCLFDPPDDHDRNCLKVYLKCGKYNVIVSCTGTKYRVKARCYAQGLRNTITRYIIIPNKYIVVFAIVYMQATIWVLASIIIDHFFKSVYQV